MHGSSQYAVLFLEWRLDPVPPIGLPKDGLPRSSTWEGDEPTNLRRLNRNLIGTALLSGD